MSIIDSLTGILAPYECVGCRTEGALLCHACSAKLAKLPERCYRCQQPSLFNRTCATCYKTSYLYKAVATTPYQTTAKQLIHNLKYTGTQAASHQMAQRMHLALGATHPSTIIIPVPTASSRIRQRGYDQARLLARDLSRTSRLPYLSALARVTQTHQVGSNRSQRLQQLSGAFRVIKPHLIKDAHIVLVDDVLTTGATLESAAHDLMAAGAKQISAIVFAQA